MSEMVYVSLRTDKPGTVNSFTVMMKANSRPAPVLRLVPDRDSRNNSVRPTARLRAVSDFQFSIRDRPCRHPSRLSVSRWNRLFECPAPRIGRRPRLRKTWFGSHSPQVRVVLRTADVYPPSVTEKVSCCALSWLPGSSSCVQAASDRSTAAGIECRMLCYSFFL